MALDPNKHKYEDEALLEHGFGITDFVKRPGRYKQEPSEDEYQLGAVRIKGEIARLQPKALLFVYKRPLNWLVRYGYNSKLRIDFGFNPHLETLFGSPCKVFLFCADYGEQMTWCDNRVNKSMSDIQIRPLSPRTEGSFYGRFCHTSNFVTPHTSAAAGPQPGAGPHVPAKQRLRS